MAKQTSPDERTAQAFATSWLNLPKGSVYTHAQFEDWISPLTRSEFEGKSVLELGCGNGSLLIHASSWNPLWLEGIDLGDAVQAAIENMRLTGFPRWKVEQADLMTYQTPQRFDVVYCIGVLHHLASPQAGFHRVTANVKPGGRFHCWVYAREGNAVIRLIVEPLRRVLSRCPWWFTKYFAAAPLAFPVFVYAKLISVLHRAVPRVEKLPLSEYFFWIAQRELSFFRHVIFDQLVTPTTRYISREEIQAWLAEVTNLDPGTDYIIFRNGNSWKFGGRLRP